MTSPLFFEVMKRSLPLALLLFSMPLAGTQSLAQSNRPPISTEERQVICQEALPLSQREAQQHPNGWAQQEKLARNLLCTGQVEAAIAIIRAMPDLFPSFKSQSYYLLGEALYKQNPAQQEVLSAFFAAFESDFNLKKLSSGEKWALAYLLLGNFHWDAVKQDLSNRESGLKKARGAYEQALTFNTNNPAIYLQLSAVHLEQGNEAEAKIAIKKAVAIKQKDKTVSPQQLEAQTYKTLALEYRALKKISSAITAQEKAIQLDPNLDRAYEVLGQLYGQSGQTKKSFKSFLKEVSKESTQSRKEQEAIAYEALSTSLQGQRDWPGVIKALQAKFKRVPLTQRWEAETYALALVKNNQREDAFQVFQEFFTLPTQQTTEPKPSPEGKAYFALGRLLAREEYFAEAQESFAKARDSGMLEAPPLGYEYGIFTRERKYKDAIAFFEHFSQHYVNADYALYLGLLHGRQGDWDAALKYFQQSIQLDPSRDSSQALTPKEEAQAYIQLGNTMLKHRRVELAQNAFQQAIRLDDSATLAWHPLAHTYWDRNQIPEAIQAFREVLRLDAEFPRVQNDLGRLLAQTGNEEEAIALLETAQKLSPTDAEPTVNLAQTKAKLRFKQQTPQPIPQQAVEDMNNSLKSILGLAGLNKAPMPPSPSKALLAYRYQQADQTVAPYLGHWIYRDIFLPFYDANIFPSKTKGRICILSQQLNHFPNYSIPMGSIVFPNSSVAFSVVDLNSNPPSALAVTTAPELLMKRGNPLEPKSIEFLGLVHEDQKPIVYAAEDKPVKPQNLSTLVNRQWKEYGCQEAN